MKHLLLDPEYWRPRLAGLESSPRNLLVFPRPDLSRPGTDVEELRLKAHDGLELEALLGRPGFQLQGECLRVRLCASLAPESLSWPDIEDGTPEVVFQRSCERRLEDRVLDVVRVARAACTLVEVECARVEFDPSAERPEDKSPDELTIARMIQDAGWLTDPGGCSNS